MIEIHNLYKKFGSQEILRGVELNIERSSTHAIIGRSGCGKSVLLKHIIGLLQPDRGDIFIGGVNIVGIGEKEKKDIRLKISMVFQESALFDFLNVEENVGFVLQRYFPWDRKEIKERVRESLEMVGLYHIEKKYPKELSGGMKKRVAIARAIAFRPRVILYDEPTAGIDPIGADVINSLIVRLHDQLAITSVVVSHDLENVRKVADTISMMLGGRIIYSGRKDDLSLCHDERVKQFVSGSRQGPISAQEV